MDQALIKAEKRIDTGKSVARKLRNEGKIPAVIYGKDVDPLSIAVSAREWSVLGRHMKRNAILDMELTIAGKAEHRPVMIKEIQREFVGDKVLHIDFLQVSMTRTIEVEIPVHLKGEAKGMLNDGIVEQHLRTIRIECLPTQIPEALEIDVSDLDIGDSFHVSQVSLSGIKVLEGGDVAIVTVAHGGVEEKVVGAPEAETEEKE
ncbi:MAG: 50S ribosomal protein L25 [Syntrophobacterales bacterium]|jgi:large subunit ribosomal protein L25|nr:50S ribosomal protein L25 [Syntrophobacterales bacterium]